MGSAHIERNDPPIPVRRRAGRVPARAGVLAVVVLVMTLLAAVPRPAEAAPLYGNDISWPQCPASLGGYGLPMPPTSTAFVIVGLTKGLAFTENPCLGSQVSWLTANSTPAHAYTMATFPTQEQLETYGDAGPWSPGTRAGRLRNVGYAEAGFALETLADVGWSPPVVWIDVEPRAAQPWPTSTAQQRLENRYVIAGLMRGLREGGVGRGFYSYTNGWNEITDSWRLADVPVWATAGRLDYPTEALDRCTQPSFSGGPVYVSQWYDSTRDYDLTCGTYRFQPFDVSAFYLKNTLGPRADLTFTFGPASGQAIVGDWDGDGADTPGVRTGSTYRLTNSNSLGLPDIVTTYGRATDEVIVGDWDGDGKDTLGVRRGSTYYLKNTLDPGPATIVTTYGRATDEVIVGDWNGDGNDTLGVRRGATYYLKNTLVPGPATIVFSYGRSSDLALAGDWDGDRDDTIGVRRVS